MSCHWTSPSHSARELEGLHGSLQHRIRISGKVRHDIALTMAKSARHQTVGIPESRPRTWNQPQPNELAEVRLYKSSQLTIKASPPCDRPGSILDPTALPQQLTELLQSASALNTIQQEQIVWRRPCPPLRCSASTPSTRIGHGCVRPTRQHRAAPMGRSEEGGWSWSSRWPPCSVLAVLAPGINEWLTSVAVRNRAAARAEATVRVLRRQAS